MGVYNELAKKLKSNKSQGNNTTTNSKDKVNGMRNNSPDLKSFLKIRSYNQSFSNFDNLLSSGNWTFSNYKSRGKVGEKTQKVSTSENKINPQLSKMSIKELSTSTNNIKVISQSRMGSDIEGPEELHFFNVGVCQNNKKLAYKFEHFDPSEEII